MTFLEKQFLKKVCNEAVQKSAFELNTSIERDKILSRIVDVIDCRLEIFDITTPYIVDKSSVRFIIVDKDDFFIYTYRCKG
jgi:hypothetical protein